MRPIAWRSLLCVMPCTLAACASEPRYIPLAQELSQRINSSNVVILITQKEIVTEIESSNLASNVSPYNETGTMLTLIGGALDAAIAQHRIRSTEENWKVIHYTLRDFQLSAELHRAFKSRLEMIPWLHVKRTEVVNGSKSKEVSQLLAAGSEDALLLLIPTYTLSPNFRDLRIEAEVRLLPRAAHLFSSSAKKATPLYKIQILYSTSVSDVHDSQEQPAKAWVSKGGNGIKQALEEGVRHTADQVVQELTSATP